MDNKNKPTKGELVEFRKTIDSPYEPVGIIDRVDGNIAYYDTGLGRNNCFIWRHSERELNALHRWGKNPKIKPAIS